MFYRRIENAKSKIVNNVICLAAELRLYNTNTYVRA